MTLFMRIDLNQGAVGKGALVSPHY